MPDTHRCDGVSHGERGVDTSTWDGPGAMSKCAKSETPGTCYRSICAGRKAGDADVQSSWALPHHKTAGGPPNAAGVRNSLSRLPQTQGLTNTEAARRHLEAHLAAINSGTNSMHTHDDDLEIFRDDLTRTVPFRAKPMMDMPDEEDGLTLDGYGAVFDAETEINSWEGQFRERIAPGAFKQSLRQRTPRMQFDHGRHPLIGSIPIGTFSDGYPQEDDHGLHVVGRLSGNWLVEPVRDAIASGAIDGMSFRFSVVRDTWTMPNGTKLSDPRTIAEFLWRPPEDGLMLRTLQEVKLSEVGPVVWPAYDETSVGVRTDVIELARLHEPATRRLLARAVLMADAADGENSTTARPQASAIPPAIHASEAPDGSEDAPGEHRSPTRQDEPTGLRTGMGRWLSSRRVVIENTQKGT